MCYPVRLMSAFPLFSSLPNLISLARLALVPVVILLIIDQEWTKAFLIFLAAGISDAVDGFLAKQFNLTSELGAYLDPLADKALLITIYVVLAVVGALPAWLTILVVFRDVLIIGAVIMSWLLDNPVTIRPLWVSKLNTAAQITLAGLVLGARGFELQPGLWQTGLVWLVALLTLASTIAYLTQWMRHMESDAGDH